MTREDEDTQPPEELQVLNRSNRLFNIITTLKCFSKEMKDNNYLFEIKRNWLGFITLQFKLNACFGKLLRKALHY